MLVWVVIIYLILFWFLGFFCYLDKDGSWFLDEGELSEGLVELGLEVDKVGVLCSCWDCDGSGILDLEFLWVLWVSLVCIDGLVMGVDFCIL